MIKTKKELEELIKKNDKVVIDFYAEWCRLQSVII